MIFFQTLLMDYEFPNSQVEHIFILDHENIDEGLGSEFSGGVVSRFCAPFSDLGPKRIDLF